MPRTSRVLDAGDGPENEGGASPDSPPVEGSEPDAGQPDAAPAEVVGAAEHYAGHLRDSTLSMFAHAAMAPFLKNITFESFRLYRDRLLADCGGPTDPIEVMIIEQLSMAHLSLGLLSAKATNAGKAEVVGIYSGAAARLMGEFRRSALALQAYRAASRQLAHDPTKDLLISADEADSAGDPPGKTRADGELLATMEASDAGDNIIPYARPETIRDQPSESPEVARHDPRGKGQGPRRDPAAPAVGTLHGATNG